MLGVPPSPSHRGTPVIPAPSACRLTEEQIKEADFEAYLGSEEEDNDEEDRAGPGDDKDADKIRERYR